MAATEHVVPPSPFSDLVRSETRRQHGTVQNSPFMADLLGGRLGLDAFTRYTGQLWFVYRALEEAAHALRDDPVAGPFLRDELRRLPALERDLAHLLGGAEHLGALAPLPATSAYAARIAEVAREWPGGYVAHHYTRYLGDLSGGQVIRSLAEKTWGLAHKSDGVRFYVFDAIDNPAAFKRTYRALLDAVPVDDLEKQRIAAECRRAYALNSALFDALGREFDCPAAPPQAG